MSDAFESQAFPGLPEKGSPALELTVKVININEGKNREKVGRSKTLAGYSAFVAKVREYEKAGDTKEEAMKKAVRYCREHDILKEFLAQNATEVMNMLMTEWNIEDAKKVWFEEGWEGGREEGREEGWEKSRETIARNALAKGASIEYIHDITGLDIETIKQFAMSNE